jgi:hypothetical protein
MFHTRKVYDLKRFMKMNEKCPVCGQRMELEIGFYYGTSYISYALTVALSVITFIAWWLTIGFSLEDHRLFYWIGINGLLLLLLQPWLMRLSRAVWLSFFVQYTMDWDQPDPAEPDPGEPELGR